MIFFQIQLLIKISFRKYKEFLVQHKIRTNSLKLFNANQIKKTILQINVLFGNQNKLKRIRWFLIIRFQLILTNFATKKRKSNKMLTLKSIHQLSTIFTATEIAKVHVFRHQILSTLPFRPESKSKVKKSSINVKVWVKNLWKIHCPNTKTHSKC